MLPVLTVSNSALGFGAQAHRVIGHIGERYLCAEARLAIAELNPGYDLAEAGLWADKIRSNKRYAQARPWHYLNVPDRVAVADRTIAAEGDVLVALERFRAVLADATQPRRERREAYLFVVHFVADVHQPLHIGRAEDRGGNTIDVRVNGRRTNLHSWWDTGVLQGRVDNAYAYAAKLANRDYRSAPGWSASGPLDWAEESKLFRPEVYAYALDPVTGEAVLDRVYQEKAIEIIDLRLSQAGVRLAATLNRLFCPADGASRPEQGPG